MMRQLELLLQQSKMSHETLKNAISINSVYPNEYAASDYWEYQLLKNGFSVERQPIDSTGRANLLAVKGKGIKSILFYGHMDTVAPAKPKEWHSDPCVPVQIGDKLYGLGSSDMKGGTSAFIEATKDTKAYVKILLAVDEENISEGGWKAVKEKEEFFKDVELVISAESSFNLGLSGITTGRTGRAVFETRFSGKPEHIIKYKEAIDALKMLSEFGHKLYEKRETMFKSPKSMVQLRKVWGESVGMSVAGDAGADIEAILGPEDSIESVLSLLQKISDGNVFLKERKTPYLPGYYFPDFPHKDALKTVIKNGTGKEMTIHTRSSVGDDNVLATLKIPVITWGPEGDNEHAPNEWVSLRSVDLLTAMYKDFLKKISNQTHLKG